VDWNASFQILRQGIVVPFDIVDDFLIKFGLDLAAVEPDFVDCYVGVPCSSLVGGIGKPRDAMRLGARVGMVVSWLPRVRAHVIRV